MAERIENFAKNPFLDGPAEFLCKVIAEKLSAVKQFKLIFGDCIDPYKRMDYSIRALPVMRIYNNNCFKTSDNAWITGDIQVDIVFPASLRRDELQQLQDTISSAIFQQFRRSSFFVAVGDSVPGLNELGRTIGVDKTLGFVWADDIVPLTQITVNFKVDLRIWDDYLTDQDRTVDDPFEKTLGDLESVFITINGVRGEEPTPVEVSITAEADV